MPSIEPSPEQLQKLVAEANDEAAIVMINLLRYRERAEYPSTSDAEPCSGVEAYQRALWCFRCSAKSGRRFAEHFSPW
jgi:hypothetical protein